MPEALRTVFEEQGEKERKVTEKVLEEPEVEGAGPRSESKERRRLKRGANHRLQAPGSREAGSMAPSLHLILLSQV